MPNDNQLALLELLKASLFGNGPVFPEHIEWDAVLAEAKTQTVVALAAKAVPQEFEIQWKNYALQSQAQFIRLLHGQAQMLNLHGQAGIPLVILKGTAAAMYYPEPFRRTMGDIDFLVPQDKFANVKENFTRYGKQSLTLFGKQFFTSFGKDNFTLPGKEFFHLLWVAGRQPSGKHIRVLQPVGLTAE